MINVLRHWNTSTEGGNFFLSFQEVHGFVSCRVWMPKRQEVDWDSTKLLILFNVHKPCSLIVAVVHSKHTWPNFNSQNFIALFFLLELKIFHKIYLYIAKVFLKNCLPYHPYMELKYWKLYFNFLISCNQEALNVFKNSRLSCHCNYY